MQVHGLQDRHEWWARRLRPERRHEVFGPLPGRWQDWEHQIRTGFHTLCPIREWSFAAAHLVTILLLEDRLELAPHLLSVLICEDNDARLHYDPPSGAGRQPH